MGLGRNFDLRKWVLFSIFPGNGFLGLDGGTSKERESALQILENYVTINWMKIFSHGSCSRLLLGMAWHFGFRKQYMLTGDGIILPELDLVGLLLLVLGGIVAIPGFC